MDRKEFVNGAVAAEGTAVLSHHAFATEGEENENRFRQVQEMAPLSSGQRNSADRFGCQ